MKTRYFGYRTCWIEQREALGTKQYRALDPERNSLTIWLEDFDRVVAAIDDYAKDKEDDEWKKQETALARRRVGARTPGSGSGWRRRNDVREGRSILWEAKQTAGVSISVKRVTWSELRKNAMIEGVMPALAIRLGDLDLVVISQDDFDTAFPPAG